jgi:hypothetical protein
MMVEQTRRSRTIQIIVGEFAPIFPTCKDTDVDYVCLGEGISFMRDLLGLPVEFDFKNPDISTLFAKYWAFPCSVFPKFLKSPSVSDALTDVISVVQHFSADDTSISTQAAGRCLTKSRVLMIYSTESDSFIGDDNF